MNSIISEMQNEDDSEYWELTPRGVNFGYIKPERRNYLETIRTRLNRE